VVLLRGDILPAQQSFDTGKQFIKMEWFNQVIVGTCLQPCSSRPLQIKLATFCSSSTKHIRFMFANMVNE
jgi:hypothetical protein